MIAQLAESYSRIPNGQRRHAMHCDLLDHLDQERALYDADLDREYAGRLVQRHVDSGGQAAGLVAEQRHWAEFRAERRRTMARLANVEERLDAMFSGAIKDGPPNLRDVDR